MEQVFRQPTSAALETTYEFCAGCGHGTSLRLVSEVIDELGLREETIGVLGVGCYSTNPVLFDFDCQFALHGRAPAMATAVKRLLPDRLVFTLQGDGDLTAIGTTEIVHAATRGERFTTIMLNNSGYGETGGIRRAFEVQRTGQGFSMVEVLTACPSGWRLSTLEAMKWMEEVQMKTYPLGDLKVPA